MVEVRRFFSHALFEIGIRIIRLHVFRLKQYEPLCRARYGHITKVQFLFPLPFLLFGPFKRQLVRLKNVDGFVLQTLRTMHSREPNGWLVIGEQVLNLPAQVITIACVQRLITHPDRVALILQRLDRPGAEFAA